MPTIINNPTGSADDSGSNLLLAVVLIIVILAGFVLFFIYGLPMMKSNETPNDTNINVTIPNTTTPPPAQ